ncbi:MAG: M48 family metallopeptidase [Clostridia bacterium]|nr:M48 family metallopeptidase [Clostridia bacterium]MDD4375259.1 M48 family metallopeptidase [Clostridia bacterium]
MILEEVRKNKVSSFIIISVFIIVIMLGVYSICMYYDLGALSIVFALAFSIIPALISYYNCDKLVLKLNGARPATKEQDLLIDSLLEGLCIASGLPKPKLYIIEDSAMNAFATGRNPETAVICLTTGIIERLDKYELEGVIAHELAHIKNHDILLFTVVSVFVGLVVILSDFFTRIAFRGSSRKRNNNKNGGIIALVAIIFIILSPIFATLMQLMLSRKREYLADSTAIEFTRNPDGLINALRKISNDFNPLETASKSTAHMYIVNPFKEKRQVTRDNLMSTHPAIENRIDKLINIQ